LWQVWHHRTQEAVALSRKLAGINLAFAVLGSEQKTLSLPIDVAYCSLSNRTTELQGTVVQRDQDTTKSYTIVELKMSCFQQTR
jgi:hypothetical protein